MTKGKKWTLRLLGVAALALLICLCLMGNTMARYTSQGTGNGTLTVALWDLEVEATLSADESISPSNDAYDTAAAARTNQSSWMVAFSIVNNSAVDAYVNVALDETTGVSFSWNTTKNGGFTWGTGWGTDNGTNAYGAKLMAGFGDSTNHFNNGDYYGETAFKNVVNDNGIFSIELAYVDASGSIELGDSDNTKLTKVTGTENNGQGVEIEAGKSLDFYAEVVWTSIYGTDTCPTAANAEAETGPAWTDWASYSDAVDTILGMYCASIDFAVTWTAVQASVQPDPNAAP